VIRVRRLALSLAVPAVVVLAAVPLGALPGRTLLPASLREGGNSRPATSEAQRSSPAKAAGSKPHAVGVSDLALACGDHDRADEPAIACRWSKADQSGFASYRLLRSRGTDPDDRIVVFHTTDRGTTSFVDETIRPNVTYTYRVEALDDGGKVIARSKDVRATDKSPEPDHVKLACRDADAPKPGGAAAPSDRDAEAIACRWTASRRPSFASYRLLRSTVPDDGHKAPAAVGGSAVVVFQTNDRDTTSYLDGTAAPDTTYEYVLEVLNGAGAVIDRSNVSRAGDEDERSDHPRLACADVDPRPQPAGPARPADASGPEAARPVAAGEREKIVCRWSRSERPDFGAYQLTRSVPGTAQPAVVVFHSDDRAETSFTDTGTSEGVTYQYVLEVLDESGRVVARSEPSRAGGGEEGTGPEPKPTPQQQQQTQQQQRHPQQQPAPQQAGAGGPGQGGGGGARTGPAGGRERRP
jgi:hypothetical protein